MDVCLVLQLKSVFNDSNVLIDTRTNFAVRSQCADSARPDQMMPAPIYFPWIKAQHDCVHFAGAISAYYEYGRHKCRC